MSVMKNFRSYRGKRKLISVDQLDEEGNVVTFENQQCKVVKGSCGVVRRHEMGTLYIVELFDEATMVATIDVGVESTLWHQILGHTSEKGMKVLVSSRRILDLKNMELGFCEPCVYGKQKKVTFEELRNAPKLEKLELVHTDVFGMCLV
ncbi:uncharacterized mitochondrial protein AtMg00300-like [Rutidosis leptorrhynchoides]|uniref:uncharacterized mitochondrial protein AtMg00300-like n=1 Tax=Rutidosis leptorrhynchoides TaxID=125765 RepID=UPI003A991F1C